MTGVAKFARLHLNNKVLVCPRCHETGVFSTDWHGHITLFLGFAMDRINSEMIDNPPEWKRLMSNDPDCGFCERLHENDPEAVGEANAHTDANYRNINDRPPIL